jgi:hypothetical protein
MWYPLCRKTLSSDLATINSYLLLETYILPSCVGQLLYIDNLMQGFKSPIFCSSVSVFWFGIFGRKNSPGSSYVIHFEMVLSNP